MTHFIILEKHQYKNYSDAMKAVETYEMETSTQFSVYMKDKEFGVPGTIRTLYSDICCGFCFGFFFKTILYFAPMSFTLCYVLR